MLKKKWWLIAALLGLSAIVAYVVWGNKTVAEGVSVKAAKSNFRDVVVSPGELMAENTEYINGPSDLQSNQIYEDIKIQDMVPEGTFVKAGDRIASLDPTLVNKKIREWQAELDRAAATVAQTALDTALSMREARDGITNLKFQMEQKRLALQLSKYEPPATIRQAEIDLEKAERDLKQMEENNLLKQRQAASKMQQATAVVSRYQMQINDLNDLRGRFEIKAPKNGLLVYINDYNGKKKTGSSVRPWDPRLAMLPDLSSMLSKTYINEVDVSKIKKDQKVGISLDAFPEVKLEGIVKSVANIGENRPGSNAKVFEVMIRLNKVDSILKPGMTTANNILINEIPNKLLIPLEAVFSEKENGKDVSFVYHKSGAAIQKREVKLGKANDETVIVDKGLEEGDEVLLAEPASAKDQKIKRL
ncbi:HlyD family efflux transporter periplasmic adaptor subunit [Chitinophaga sedimenti]|uniref:efflux RND transporter periplasmic adaptor subunit n=1 Tax=Chitinophaga sedimenti TaxID=2033606 RepID=UPI0020060E33|nr:HlyD family efflux transporter periplasmic adaptor subunit [Chitinophaga sedimenti]MCK7557648.1 HlyD family efflux transporter periplasmic adaptor subunit [Chitinophaga sedimenti]